MDIQYKNWLQLIDFINTSYLNCKILKENIVNDNGLYFNFTLDYQMNPAIAVWDYKKSNNFCFSGFRTDGHNSIDKITESIPISKFFEIDTETNKIFSKMLIDIGLCNTRKINVRKFINSDLCGFLMNRNNKWYVLNNSLINTILNKNFK